MAVCDGVCSRLAAWISDPSVRGGRKRAHLYFCARTANGTAVVVAAASFGRGAILVAEPTSPVFCVPTRAAACPIEVCCI